MDQGQGQMIVHFQPSFTELLSENQDQDLRLVMKTFLNKLYHTNLVELPRCRVGYVKHIYREITFIRNFIIGSAT